MLAIFGYVVAALAGGIVSLKVIAPKTKTKKDDKVLATLERVDDVLKVLVPFVKANPLLNKNGK